jgi:hypothetical protein
MLLFHYLSDTVKSRPHLELKIMLPNSASTTEHFADLSFSSFNETTPQELYHLLRYKKTHRARANVTYCIGKTHFEKRVKDLDGKDVISVVGGGNDKGFTFFLTSKLC